MKITKLSDFARTCCMDAVRTRDTLRSLYSIINQKFPRQFKKFIHGISFPDIDPETPVGDRLSVKDRISKGKVLDIDITHVLETNNRNQILVHQASLDLVCIAKQFLDERNIPYHLINKRGCSYKNC